MPIIVCFEGQLTAHPEVAAEAAEAVTTATVTVPPPSSRKVATTYHLRAHGARARALAELSDGDSVVVIGHVETEAATHPNTGPGRTYRDTVVVDSIGASLSHSTH